MVRCFSACNTPLWVIRLCGEQGDMHQTGLTASLYPAVLVGANVAVGAGLYRLGALAAAALVLLCGLFVLAGIVSAARPTPQQPLEGTV